jgi:FAD/FMN-containing dehydrogenase
MLVGFDPLARSWVTLAQAQQEEPWAAIPKLDGVLTFDDVACEAMSLDGGRVIHRLPHAVLRPASVADVVRMTAFAHEHRIKIVTRGQGHSQYGQTLTDGGIVIDSSTLNAVSVIDATTVSAQPGATWNDVTRATLARQLTPPAMGNTMTLSVGGILSAGGISNRSHDFGAVVDTVKELDVVTGDGRLVTCSERHERELFEMILGGMGQCGLIVGTRIRLVPAPAYVVRRDFLYDDVKAFLDDLTRITLDRKLDHLAGYGPLPTSPSATSFRINVGRFCDTPDAGNAAIESAGLRGRSVGPPAVASYADYLQREAASNAAGAAARRANPQHNAYIAMFVPLDKAAQLITSIVDTAGELAGVARFPIQALITRQFTRPLLTLPASDTSIVLWLFRSVPANDGDANAAATTANHAILDRMRSMGGKAYPPYSPYFSPSDWKEHYGAATWRRLTAAKAKCDPRGVLTPGPGVFVATKG